AAGRRAYAEAAKWIGLGLDDADRLLAQTGATISREELDVLWFAAELGAGARVPLPFDVSKRLRAAQDELVRRHDRSLRAYERWVEVYLALHAAPRAGGGRHE
ncbi:MAG TPA: hypothetical protein VHB21_28425, partial [Minicystis sp.]|nr:hypothetical protein [Minicystis sp.]